MFGQGRCSVFQCRLYWTSVLSFTLKRNLAQVRRIVFEKKAKTTHINFEKNDVTEPKARLLSTS